MPRTTLHNLPGGTMYDWRAGLLGSLVLMLTMVAVLRAFGRLWWCQCGTSHLWASDVWSEHNSQHLADAYALSHFQHGMLLYATLRWAVPALSAVARLLLAIAVESAWEIVENTNWLIERYRDSTMALNYYGDSIVNSLGDTACCALGYGCAAGVPLIFSVVVFVSIEVAMLAWIRDSLLINVLMLIWPLDAVKQWQIPT